MKKYTNYLHRRCISGGFVAPLILAASSVLAAEPGSAPDFSGLWRTNSDARDATRIVDGRMPDGTAADPVPGSPSTLTEEGRRRYERNKAGIAASDASIDEGLRCVPSGFPRVVLNVAPVLIVQNDDVVVWVGESNHGIARKIWMTDEHQDLWPFMLGDSIAHWEGDTLIVDTTDIHERTFFNTSGLPHSSELHVIERWRLIDGGSKFENRITFIDPVIFTEPWETTQIYERTDLKPVENICTDPLPIYR